MQQQNSHATAAAPVLYRCCLSCRFVIKMDTQWVSRLQSGI